MGSRAGISNNPKGRPPGVLSKASKELRVNITRFLEDNFEQVEKEFKTLSAKDKLAFYKDLLQYCLPKLQANGISLNAGDLSEVQLDEMINQFLKEAGIKEINS